MRLTTDHVEAVIATWETQFPEGGEQLELAIVGRFRTLVGSQVCPDDLELSRAIRDSFAGERHRCPVDSRCSKVCPVKLRTRPPRKITCPTFIAALQT